MSTHLTQYVAACRLEDDLRASAGARAVPRPARRRPSAARLPRLRRFHRPVRHVS